MRRSTSEKLCKDAEEPKKKNKIKENVKWLKNSLSQSENRMPRNGRAPFFGRTSQTLTQMAKSTMRDEKLYLQVATKNVKT